MVPYGVLSHTKIKALEMKKSKLNKWDLDPPKVENVACGVSRVGKIKENNEK